MLSDLRGDFAKSNDVNYFDLKSVIDRDLRMGFKIASWSGVLIFLFTIRIGPNTEFSRG